MMKNQKSALIQALLKGELSRRQFVLRMLALGVSASTLGSFLQSPALAQEDVAVQWWDQFEPLVPLHETLWNAFSEEHPGVGVEYTQFNPAEMGQALQLAFRSGQAPDVHSLAGLEVPVSQLVAQDWFVPLSSFDASTPFLRSALFEGLTVFNGQTYSFPIFSFRQHETSLWFNKTMMEAAGFDPEVGPRTWDEVREAARAITEGGNGRTFGLLMPIQFAERMAAHVSDLAEIAGAPGGVDWTTGEYAYGSEPFVAATQFLLSFQEDGSLHPASSSLDARNGRARWAAGEAGMFFDGPWNAGVLQLEYPEIIDNIGVARIPAPAPKQASYTYNPPPGGVFWVSSQSDRPEIAAQILQRFTSDDYYVGLAEQMDQPPLDLSAVERANVHPIYRQAISYFQDTVRLSPEPLIKNPNVAQVYAEMREITPDLGEIVQGVFSGGVGDIGATLQAYADQLSAERERAIQVVQDRGVEVSLDDWVFPNWQPGEDYTPEKYQ